MTSHIASLSTAHDSTLGDIVLLCIGTTVRKVVGVTPNRGENGGDLAVVCRLRNRAAGFLGAFCGSGQMLR
jgi:hypothetical protein